MRFWTRELAGWLLLALGLYVFYRSYTLLTDPTEVKYLEAGTLALIGIFLFRGGNQMLKTALAAQVCMETQERLERDRAKPGTMSPPSRLPGNHPSSPYAERSGGSRGRPPARA